MNFSFKNAEVVVNKDVIVINNAKTGEGIFRYEDIFSVTVEPTLSKKKIALLIAIALIAFVIFAFFPFAAIPGVIIGAVAKTYIRQSVMKADAWKIKIWANRKQNDVENRRILNTLYSENAMDVDNFIDAYNAIIQKEDESLPDDNTSTQYSYNTETWVCPGCGNIAQAGQKFCTKCGTPKPV